MMNIEITKAQATGLIDFIELEFITSIKNDPDIDNIQYVVNICEVYTKLKESVERKMRENE